MGAPTNRLDYSTAGRVLLFKADFNDLTTNDSATTQLGPGYTIDQNVKHSGNASLSLLHTIGDPLLASGSRSEIFSTGFDPLAYQEYLFEWYHLIPQSWRIDEDVALLGQCWSGEVITPPFTFGIVNNNWTYRSLDNELEDNIIDSRPVQRRKWVKHQVFVRWSETTDGVLRVLRDGKLVYSRDGQNKRDTSTPTGDVSIKGGVYKFGWNDDAGTPGQNTVSLHMDDVYLWGRDPP